MKIPRILSSGLGRWFSLALLALPVLAARTLIVASDAPGEPVEHPTRFVMSDEASRVDATRQPTSQAPDEAGRLEPQFYTDPQQPFPQPTLGQQASPVVREAVQPMWQPGESPSHWSTSWQASDPIEHALDAFPPAKQAFAELPSGFQHPSQSVVQQAYNPFDENGIGSLPLAGGKSESAATQFTVQVPEDQVTRLLYQETPELPPSVPSSVPQDFAEPEAPLAPQADAIITQPDVTEAAPIMPAPGETPVVENGVGLPATPLDLPQVASEADMPASPSDEAALPRIEEQPPAAVAPTSEPPAAPIRDDLTPVEEAPFVPEPEAFPSDPYGLMPDGAAYEQPAMPADCGMACPLTWYARAEMLYVQRITEDHITLTDDDLYGLDRMGFTPGARATIGRIGDCLDGFEFVYTGGLNWTERSLITGASLNPKFTSDKYSISSFQDAQEHRQEYRSDFHSAELNRKWWGWDIISTTVGFRYMYVGEKYRFDSFKLNEGPGSLKMAMDNHYMGPQIGLDLYRPIGRWTTEMRSKAGVFLNYVDFDYGFVNNGVTQFDVGSEKGQLGFEAEIGLYAKYQLLPRLSIQAGYELWYLYGVATPTSQSRSRIHDYDGAYSKDDIFYHGGSVGVELVW